MRKAARLLKSRIAIFSAAIMMAMCGLVAEAVLKEREAAMEEARAKASTIATSLEDEVSFTLNVLAGSMHLLRARIETEGPAFDLNTWMGRIPELLRPAIQIVLVDAAGKVKASAPQQDPNRVYPLEHDFFAAHRKDPQPGFLIGEPAAGNMSMRIVIPETGRTGTEAGSFAGVLKFILDPDLLVTLHRKISLGQSGVMNVMRGDGVIVARYTQSGGLDHAASGIRVKGFEQIWRRSGARNGEYRATSAVDGVKRLYNWRKVPGYPLFAVAGIGEAEALSAAGYRAKIIIGLGIAALSLPLIMMFMLNREITRRVENAVALDRESEKVHLERAALLAITEELAKERIKLRRSNRELALARRRAEDANRAKSVFLANMSHELRTPLNAVLGFSEIIRDRLFGNDAERYSEYAADIHRSGAHLLSIVNDILDVTRIEAGKFELREEKVKLSACMEESLLAVEPQAAKERISLTRTFPDTGAIIIGDKTKLSQIVINLLSNAIKFTPQGGSVDLSARPDKDGGLIVTVRDTGIGMAKHEIRDAIELFRQVDNSLSRRYEGTGLGLPLAIQLTELHGGTLTIDSTPGRGTTVTVRLPGERIEWDGARTPDAANDLPLKIAS